MEFGDENPQKVWMEPGKSFASTVNHSYERGCGGFAETGRHTKYGSKAHAGLARETIRCLV